jgi:hypothetical protein
MIIIDMEDREYKGLRIKKRRQKNEREKHVKKKGK